MFLGIDGGGTKTAFVLLGEDGRVLANAAGSGTYHPEVGLDGVRSVLSAGIASVLQAAGAAISDVRFAFFGLPAYGEDPAVDPALAALPAAMLPTNRYLCGNDMICSWAGGLACEDGISVIAGTGSIAYGEYAGRSARAGGWGELFGDEGSAHWIAREGLGLFSRMCDGRAEPGLLRTLLREHFSLRHDLDLAGLINDPGSAARAALAQLSQIVASAALAGDALATQIYARAGAELAALVHATGVHLDVPEREPLAVTYSGGVFNTGALTLEPFRQALLAHGRGYVLTAPRCTPDLGAALYAARAVGVRFLPEQIDRLAASPRA